MIFGLCGLKGSGKTLVANYLNSEHGFRSVNMKDGLITEMKERLSDTLDALASHYGADIDWLFQNKPFIMRELMQNYGTEVRRGDNPDYWVNQWIESIRDGGNIVCDDIRFPNELSALRNEGGLLIRVKMPELKEDLAHESEQHQQDFDEDFLVVASKGDHNSLYGQIEDIIQTIKENTD